MRGLADVPGVANRGALQGVGMVDRFMKVEEV